MIILREACSSDNERILELTSIVPMKGRISLRIDRNPDFFNLLKMRGESIVFVAEKNKKIVGCFSASSSNISINGNRELVYYLADLKIDPLYEGRILTARLLNKMAEYIRNKGADILFCTVAYGNEKVKPLLTGRLDFPKFNFAGIFRIYQIIPILRKIRHNKYSILEIDTDNTVGDLYSRFYYKRYQYCPVFPWEVDHGTRTIAAMENDNLLASLTLSDVGFAKQNVLIRLPGVLRFIILVLGLINLVSPIFTLPEIGKPVKILYIKAFAFNEGGENALDGLIRHAGNLAHSEKYHYLAIGIHERDPLAKLFTKYLHFTFNSLGYIVSLKGNYNKIIKILNGVLFEDYSLV